MYIIVLSLIVLAQLGDVYSTNLVLTKRGGFNPSRESNPVLRWMMLRLGRAWPLGKLAVAGVFLFALWRVGPQPLSYAVSAGILGAYLWVIQHNLRQYRK